MAIDLTKYELGRPFVGDLPAALAALGERLARAQLSQIVHRRRAIIVVEGPEGGGKRAFVKLLGGALEPTHVSVCSVVPDRRRSIDGHWLARFWAELPEAGHSTIFFHSWYRRVLEDKLLGLVSDKEWKRAFDEINEYEAQQRDYGTLIVKLLFHVTEAVRERRIAEREADEWQRHRLGPKELRTAEARTTYREALNQLLAQSDTRWAPWSMIDANDQGAAQAAALGAVTEAMEKEFPLEPPAVESSVVLFPKTAERAPA